MHPIVSASSCTATSNDKLTNIEQSRPDTSPTHRRRSWLGIALLILASLLLSRPGTAQQCSSADLGSAQPFNALIFGDFTSTGSDTEGRMAIQGDLTLNHYSVADKLSAASAGTSVIVGGDFNFPSGKLYYGDAVVAGNAILGAAVVNGLTPDQTVTDNAVLPLDFAAAQQEMSSLSDNLSALPANGTFVFQYGGFQLQGDGASSLQVFDLDGGNVLSAHTFNVTNIPAGATIVFNISGASTGLTNMSLQSLETHRDRVVFNFYEATELTLGGIGVEGTILAPDAVIDNPQGVIRGSVIAASWNGLMQLNSDPFVGCFDGVGGSTNQAPLADDLVIDLLEDSIGAIDLVASDPDGDALTYELLIDPASGSLSGVAPSLSYAPNANYNGADTFTFRVSDGELSSAIATVTINVAAVNDAPVSDTIVVDALEDTAVSLTLMATDIDGDALSYAVVTPPANGSITGSAPNLIYTPNLNYSGSDTIAFIANDGVADSLASTVTINVGAVNDVPVANDVSVSVDEDAVLVASLIATDPDNDALTYAIVDQPGQGTLTLNGSSVSYTPNQDFFGTDSFTYQASDDQASSDPATVSVTVNSVNDTPFADDQNYVTEEDTQLEITLAGTDVDGDALTYSVTEAVSNGTLSGSGSMLSYLPNPQFNGVDSFVYVLNDGSVDSAPITVLIDVTPVNDAPVADVLSVSTAEDTNLAITLSGSDLDADTLSFTVQSGPTSGSLTGAAPNLIYSPAADFNGVDSFTYFVSDSAANSPAVAVMISVASVNDAPTAIVQDVSTSEDASLAITLEGQDVDGDALTFDVTTQPQNGTLTGVGADLTYTPNANFFGTDSFMFAVSDGVESSEFAEVVITVAAVNDTPVAVAQVASTNEDSSVDLTLTGVDAEGDVLTFSLLSQPTNGALIGAPPSLSYVPSQDFYGADSFEFGVSDATTFSSATVSITVLPVNDAPIAQDIQSMVTAGESVQIPLLATDQEGGALTYRIVSGPSAGAAVINGSVMTFDSVLSNDASLAISYVANDGEDDSNIATVTVSVLLPDQPPQITSLPSAQVPEFANYFYDVVAVDPNDDILTYSLVNSPVSASIDAVSGLMAWQPASNYESSILTPVNQCRRVVGDVGDFVPTVKWAWQGEPEYPGNVDVFGPPVVGQLTDDNDDGQIDARDIPDLVFGARNRSAVAATVIFAISGDDGSAIWSFDSISANVAGGMALGDIDQDGFVEVVAQNFDRTELFALNHDGTLAWSAPTGSPAAGQFGSRDSLSIADLDGDGNVEIIQGRRVFNADGSLLWAGVGDHGGQIDYGVVSIAADVDLDGQLEVVAGRTLYSATGSIIWQLDFASDGFSAVGNFDSDDFAEIVLVHNGRVSLVEHTGDPIWTNRAIPIGGVGGPPTVADIDGDGELEIGVAGARTYAVFETDGSLKWQFPTFDQSSNRTGSSVFDFEGDGRAEILYFDERNFFVFDGASGSVRYTLVNRSATALEYPIVADVDNDGEADIVLPSSQLSVGSEGGGIRVLESGSAPWPATRTIWNQHAYSINNINDDGTVPAYQEPSWLSHNTYRLNTFADRNALDLPELTLSGITLDANAGSISVIATNRGNAPTQDDFDIRFYQGSDASGLLLGFATVQSMAARESRAVVVDDIDVSAITGDLYVVIDEAGVVDECLEQNNATIAAVFNVRVVDTTGLFDNQTFAVSVSNVNESPLITSTPNLLLRLGEAYDHTATAEDPDLGDALSFSLVEAPDGLAIEESTGVFSYDAGVLSVGTYNVLLRATDLGGLTSNQGFSLQVLAGGAVNLPPVISSVPNAATSLGRNYLYQIVATDPEDDALTYAITEGPSSAVISAETGLLVWVPDSTSDAATNFGILVTDPEGATASQTFSVQLSAQLNTPPMAVARLTPSGARQIQVVSGNAAIGEVDPEVQRRTGAADAWVNPVVVETDVVWDVLPGAQWLSAPQFSQSTFRTVFDLPEFATAPSLALEFLADNAASVYLNDVLIGQQPEVAITEHFRLPATPAVAGGSLIQPGQNELRFELLDFGGTVGINYAGSLSYQAPAELTGVESFDADGDPLTYLWRIVEPADADQSLLSSSTDPTTALLGPMDVPYLLELTVSDGTDQDTVTVSVSGQNTAPIAIAKVSRTQGSQTEITLDGSQSFDPDGNAMTYSWRAIAMPAGADAGIAEPTSVTTTATPTIAGTYVFELIVNDGIVDSAPDIAVVNSVNLSPVADAGPDRRVTAGNVVALDASDSFDPDQNALTYSWRLTAVPENSNAALGLGSGVMDTLITDVPGTYVVQLEVFDGEFVSAPDTVVITAVTSFNNDPVFVSAPPAAVPFGLFSYDADATDIDGDQLTYSLGNAPQGMQIDPPTGLISWATSQIGNFDISVVVADGRGGDATQSFTIAVESNGSVPVIVSAPPTAITLNNFYSYDVEVIDSDGDTLTFSLASAPSGMTIDATTGLVQWQPDAVGNFAVSIRVEDDDGNVVSQSFDLVVTVPNTPPVITSTPATFVFVGQTYQYLVQANDVDGDALTFSLGVAPSGMTVDATSGAISWSPDFAGTVNVQVDVSDGRGGVTSQVFSITIQDGSNGTPAILSEPAYSAKTAIEYTYQLLATDPDNDALTYSLTTAPSGMIIDQNGLMRWTPSVVGVENVVVRVSDGQSFIEQGWAITVTDGALPLDATLYLSNTNVELGDTLFVTVLTENTSGDVTFDLTIGGLSVPMGADGQASFVTTIPGTIAVSVTVTDSSDSAVRGDTFVVTDTVNPSELPVVSLASPESEQEVTAPTDVIGSVTDDNLARWTLFINEIGRPMSERTEIATGTNNFTDAVIGQVDPTLLINGLHRLILEAEDLSGNIVGTDRSIRVTGDMKVGNFSITFEDIAVPVAGVPISVTRTYDSRRRNANLDFGFGWSVDYQNVRVQESRDIGFSWAITEERFGFFGRTCVRPNGDPTVTVALPDGEVETFIAKASPECSFAAQPFVNIVFEPTDFTDSTLAQTTYGLLRIINSNLVDPEQPTTPVDPDTYSLTTEEGVVYELDQSFGIRRVIDTHGNTLTYSDDGIVHSDGFALDFVRDTEGRITRIDVPDGTSMTYGYDANGDLERFTDQQALETRFTYKAGVAHYLEDIIDPRGIAVSRSEYDDDGRLTAIIDADGNRIEYTHNIDGRLEIIRDRRGNATTYIYDDEGNVLSETNALGETTIRTYDADRNTLTETTPLGYTTTMTYDLRGNELTSTDPLGNLTTNTYDDRNLPLTVTDPIGNVVMSNTYDTRNTNLLTMTDALGQLTTFHWDSGIGSGCSTGATRGVTNALNDRMVSQPRCAGPLTGLTRFVEDERGVRTSYDYDTLGRRISETTTRTDENGVVQDLVTLFVYDDKGRVVQVTDPDGNVTLTEYNGIDKETATVDALGRRTEMDYDARGNLVMTTYPDSTTEIMEYDPNDNLIAQTDRLGRTTRMVFDAANRLIETHYPDATPFDLTDNPRILNEYDLDGRMIASIDERGNRTEYEYDNAGRRTLVRNAIGEVTRFEYDARGLRTAMIDELGRRTEYVYDVLSRLVETRHPIGVTDVNGQRLISATSYDALGRKLTETDPAGVATQFEYDEVGNLTAVIDALGQRTEYAYDEQNNKRLQRDANGHETTWTYDNLGRTTGRILPLGQSESFTYDAVSNRLTRIDFNGASSSYTYDALNRQITASYADGITVTTDYTDNGLVERITNENGITSYSYDERDRLIRVDYPAGGAIDYGYDASSNRTTLTTQHQSISYTFDALNRLYSVTDAQGQTIYGYDGVGNRSRIDHANGSFAEYVYDDLNRLTTLSHFAPDLSLLSEHSYTLGDAGNRLGLTETLAQPDGSTVSRNTAYGYDTLYRLTSETVTDATHGNRTTSWIYDPVGNRLSQTIGTDVTTYNYDDNDRLSDESAPEGLTTYVYDGNGNTLTRSAPGLTTLYRYDSRDRLIDVDGLTQYTYDASGIRQSVISSGIVTRYLTDPNRDYAQVIEARDALNALTISYTYGDDLISQHRVTGALISDRERSIFHYDGLGSTRMLTDTAGTVSDSYLYTAFGEDDVTTGITANDYRYTGEQFDPNVGFYYLRARYYNAAIGRFQNRDTFAGRMHEPQTLHKYLYVHSNPINMVDPSGNIGNLADVGASLNIRGSQSTVSTGARLNTFRGLTAANDPVFILLTGAGGRIAQATAVAALALAQRGSSTKRRPGRRLNAMRLQLQQDSDTYWSMPIGFLEPRYVERSIIWAMLTIMENACDASDCIDARTGRSFPARLQGELGAAVVKMSKKVRSTGVVTGGHQNIHREFVNDRTIASESRRPRIDLEHISGTNFREPMRPSR